jgi:hypothetical protein
MIPTTIACTQNDHLLCSLARRVHARRLLLRGCFVILSRFIFDDWLGKMLNSVRLWPTSYWTKVVPIPIEINLSFERFKLASKSQLKIEESREAIQL